MAWSRYDQDRVARTCDLGLTTKNAKFTKKASEMEKSLRSNCLPGKEPGPATESMCSLRSLWLRVHDFNVAIASLFFRVVRVLGVPAHRFPFLPCSIARTTSTGQGAWRMTRSAVLPK
jgi:hypothetical protein